MISATSVAFYSTSALMPLQMHSLIRLLDQKEAGKTWADSRHDKQPDRYRAQLGVGGAGRDDALEGE